jgi:heme oxygenase (biliverdin-IX-beta and delta-forming)
MSCASVGSVRDVLRTATANIHERLDGAAAGYSLQRRTDYGRFLMAHAAALLPLEQELEQAGIAAILPDWLERRRSAALGADLRALDLGFAPLGAPLLGSHAAALGAAYVLEGSRLGARVLLLRVESCTDHVVLGATRYLRHGEGKRLWQSFLALLEAAPGLRQHADAAVAGAEAAFLLFERALLRHAAAPDIAAAAR